MATIQQLPKSKVIGEKDTYSILWLIDGHPLKAKVSKGNKGWCLTAHVPAYIRQIMPSLPTMVDFGSRKTLKECVGDLSSCLEMANHSPTPSASPLETLASLGFQVFTFTENAILEGLEVILDTKTQTLTISTPTERVSVELETGLKIVKQLLQSKDSASKSYALTLAQLSLK